MSYRKEFNKVYKKINTIAQKGNDGVFDYYIYIDDLVDTGQYPLLEDVMSVKYRIDIRQYNSINDMKHRTFDTIRQHTISSFQSQLKALFDKRSVYPVGFHFYDSLNNHYLGDIKEVEEERNWIAYKDPKLSEKQDQIKVINLEVTSGLHDSVVSSIPTFIDNAILSYSFTNGDLVKYNGGIYECVHDYKYDSQNLINPTYGDYWMQIYSPTYSFTLIDDDLVKLIDKYNTAITIVKSFIYIDPSSTDYIDSNYIDDYFE